MSARRKSNGTGRATHTPLWTRTGYLIRRVHQNHSALWAEECKAFGITPVQYGVLTALLHRPGIDQATLGAECGIDRTNAADVVKRLAERGLVKRAQGAHDRRMMLAEITQEGAALTQAMRGAMLRAQDRLLEALSETERARFMQLLRKLADAIGAPADAAPQHEAPRRARKHAAR